jgi:CBS domain-containing protein
MDRNSEGLDEGRVTLGPRSAQPGDHICGDVMKTDVVSVTDGDSIVKAAQLMKQRRVGFLPVCNDARKVLGTLTDRDLAIRAVAENRVPEPTRVAAVMTHDLVWCAPGDTVARAEELMADHQVSRIVVVSDEGTLRGVISLSDIVDREEESRATAMLRESTARER